MKYLMTFVFAIFLFGCQKKFDQVNTNKVATVIHDLKEDKYFSDSVKKIYFLNIDQGCESCIDKCLSFIQKQQNNPKFLFFILSSYDNSISKILKQYSLKVNSDNNIFIDKNLLASKSGLIDVFPTVYYVDDKRVLQNKNIDATNIDQELVSN